jgi:hypothetical protein
MLALSSGITPTYADSLSDLFQDFVDGYNGSASIPPSCGSLTVDHLNFVLRNINNNTRVVAIRSTKDKSEIIKDLGLKSIPSNIANAKLLCIIDALTNKGDMLVRYEVEEIRGKLYPELELYQEGQQRPQQYQFDRGCETLLHPFHCF